jgi:hypothetical protein
MADHRRFELDELSIRPGTYFNPQTEIMLVVDDSSDVDHEIFDMDEFEGAEWVLISDDAPVDEHQRDELIESFQVTYHPGGKRALDDEPDEEEEDEEKDDLDPDEEEEELGLDREAGLD